MKVPALSGSSLPSRSRRDAIWAVLSLVAVGLAIAGERRLWLRDYVLDGALLLGLAIVLFLVSVHRGRGAGAPSLWPEVGTAGAEANESALLGDRLRWILLAFSALSAAVAFVSLGGNRFTARGLVGWCVAVLTWLLAVVSTAPQPLQRLRLWSEDVTSRLLRRRLQFRVSRVALVLLLILGISFFFHVNRTAWTPAEAQSDHVEASEDVRSILNGQHMIFFPRNTGREATQFYLTALMSHLTGYSFFTLKLTMALVGSLNVIPMFFLGKELVDRRFGLLAAFLMAVSYWHIIVSRIGWRIVLAPFWTTVTLWLLLRAFRRGRRNDFLLAGLALGAGLYGYMSFRITPLLVVALFGLNVLLDRSWRSRLATMLTNGALLVVTSLMVYLPMLRYMYDEPQMLWYRVLTRTTDLERTLESPLSVFLDNVKRGLLMFNWMGDGAWTASIPNRPALDYVSGGLFILGAAYLFYLLLAKRRRVALYLLVSVFMLLLPSTLAIAFPVENPSNIRASGVIPVVLLMAALPLYVVGKKLAASLRGGPGKALALALTAMLAVQTARLNYRLYYVSYHEQYQQSAWNASDMAQVMQGFADSMGSIYDTYLIGTAYWVDHRAIALTLRNMEWNNLIMDMNEAVPHLSEPRNRLYLFHPSNDAAQRWLAEHYPQGQLMRFQAFSPEKDFMVFVALAGSQGGDLPS